MSTANTSWANRTKAAVVASPTKQLKKVGGGGNLEPINTYFQFNPPKPEASEKAAQLVAGAEILGTYDGNFTTKGQYPTTYYKVRTLNGLVAVPSTGQLKSTMSKIPVGAEVQIVYKGKEKMAKGAFAGKAAHSFDVSASEVIE